MDSASREWRMRRNCALAPRQVLWSYLLLCLVSLPLALGFALLGYVLIGLFALAELAGAALALLVWARHAGDTETLRLQGRRLSVERRHGTALECTELDTVGLSVSEP
ncbi:MAG: DUF2244 domain-containing protein, partial [Burkholderiales bacterium]|nr:DUF2244 domain-containing protein [Burkholderiales bacterium]